MYDGRQRLCPPNARKHCMLMSYIVLLPQVMGLAQGIPCGPSSLAPQQVALLPDALVDFVKHGAGSTAGGAAA